MMYLPHSHVQVLLMHGLELISHLALHIFRVYRYDTQQVHIMDGNYLDNITRQENYTTDKCQITLGEAGVQCGHLVMMALVQV